MGHRHLDNGVRLHGRIHLYKHLLAIWGESREVFAPGSKSGAIAVHTRSETCIRHSEREQVCLGRIHAYGHKLERSVFAWYGFTLATIETGAGFAWTGRSRRRTEASGLRPEDSELRT